MKSLTWSISFGAGRFHVVPDDDLAEHFEEECWCNPTDDPENPAVLVHHALDRREEHEEGRAVQ